MKEKLKKLFDRYIFLPSNESRSYCPDCSNDLEHDSKSCPECGSKRKSVEIKITEPLYIGGFPYFGRKFRQSFISLVARLLVYGSIAFFLLSIDLEFIKRIETLDWFFSTVAQGYIALIALLIAVATFRIQQNNYERSKLGSRILEQVSYFKGGQSDGMTIDDAISFAKSINKNDYSEVVRVERLKSLSERVKFLDQSSQTTRRRLKKTFKASTVAVLSSLLFLILADYIFVFNFAILALLVVSDAVFVATFYTWKLVKSLR